MSQLFTRRFIALMGAHLLQGGGYASMLLLPLYLSHLGANRATIGGIMGASAIGGLILRPLVGWALDTKGRKWTIRIGTAITVVGMLLIGLVDDIGVLIYTSRILFGIGTGALFTAYFTLAADIVPSTRRTEGIALFGVTGLLPLVVNPIAHEVGIAASSIQWFLPAMGLVVLGSLLPMWWVHEPERPATPPTSLQHVGRTLFAANLLPVWFATFVFSGLVATAMAFGMVAAEQRGIDRPAIMWLTYACAAAFIRIVGAKLPERVGDSNIVAPALAAYVLGILCLASAHSSSGMAVGGALCGLGHGYCFPVLTSQVVSRCSEALRGSALSLFTGLWDITYLLYPPILGMVSDAHGDQVMFIVAASVATLGLAGWLSVEHRLGGRASP